MFYAVYHSPIGKLGISANDKAIVEITFGTNSESQKLTNEVLDKCLNQLKEYFNNERTDFDIPLEFSGTDFQNRVWNELLNIPFGQSISYSELAIRLGDIKCIRAAGTANGKNKLPIVVPCHRVIGKNGSLVGFAGGLENKKWLLKHEGVIKGEQLLMFD